MTCTGRPGAPAGTEAYRRETDLTANREENFRLLYELHRERVVRYVARRTTGEDVQDLVAETFLTAWRRFDDLPRDPVPWLFVTARNLIANRRRSAERARRLGEKLATAPSWEPPPGPSDELDQRLLDAIAALPEAEREALMLVAWDGLDPARASRAAGCRPATFRMRLHRARRRLRQELPAARSIAPVTNVSAPLEDRR